MLAAAVVSHLPLGIDNRTLAGLDDAIASPESSRSGGADKVYVSPLVLMVMDVVRDLGEQYTLSLQNAIRLLEEGRISVGKAVAVLLGRTNAQAKTGVEVLRLVLSLVGNVGGS